MPMTETWTEPEIAVEHNGLRVYHTYKYDMISEYWYTTDANDDDYECDHGSQFDVRDLDVDIEGDKHEDIIRAAIDAGILKAPEEA